MKAAVYHGNRDLRIESMPEPGKPGPGQVILEVLRGAICGTDVTEYLHGPHFASLDNPHPASGHQGPLISGHEFVGKIVEIGAGVEGLQVGQRVVPGAGNWCGTCQWCLAGRVNLCKDYFVYGLSAHGGLAEMSLMPAYMCRVVPDACSDDAAAMAQPLAVALHAVDRSGATPGQSVALMGVGGIGSFILDAAQAQGLGPIIAVDIDDERLERATQLGAAHVVNARSEDPVEAIRRLTDGLGVATFIEASGSPPGPGTALAATQKGGHILIVGMQAEPRSIDFHDMTYREITMTTTVAHVCTVDLPKSLEILATTDLADLTLDRVIPLENLVDEGILALADGRAKGKVVVNPNL
ncbi:MAG: alcohol dehydrogenase catalytic domain-containing protein [Anaerolineae bacterium]|nr:alcohol dehydrogenase catalytic domain-containing protein [Anaerolineae bacterium]